MDFFSPRKLSAHPKPLGRVVPQTDEHIRKHPLAATRSTTTIEHTMKLPFWHWLHDQGAEGACVGHGTAMERAIRELYERRQRGDKPNTVRFDAWWLWDAAKLIDPWPDTNPGDDNGTLVSSAYDVVRRQGAVRAPFTSISGRVKHPVPDRQWTVTANQWATQVSQIRACIARDQPVTIGVNWYTAFDSPVQVNGEWFIGRDPRNLGSVRGGHCVCIYGASDRRQAFRVKNSWGRSYPLVWLPYETMQRLLNEDGEATVVTDND